MILAIVGPTGVGKTKLSIELAKRYNAVILNCDAMQVYKDLNIGTAKIKEEEKEGIEHYLFDFVDVKTNFTVFDYQKYARRVLEKCKNRNIIFVGGTGLYLKAALFDYRFTTDLTSFDDAKYRNEELYHLCLEKDSSCKIHPNNRRRLIRFLEKESHDLVEPKLLYDAKFIGLTIERNELYSIINNRVDKMLKEGLEAEVKAFYDQGIHSKALINGIGYKEFYRYFDGEISYEECVEEIKKNSRHYAKRQYTFFRHQLPVTWFNVNVNDFSKTINEVIESIEENKI